MEIFDYKDYRSGLLEAYEFKLLTSGLNHTSVEHFNLIRW